jgi:tripartite-type tricarboxylate transporter receptor subunit TctC
MIVPFAPGATGDILGRLYGEELGKAFGQTFVIDNKTGAGGTIAMAETARVPADGYTIAVVSQGTLVYDIGLYKTPGYDPLKDLVLMSVNTAVSNILIVPPSNPAKTLADVIAQARAKPGEFTYSSGGVGTSHHMSGVLLEMRTGLKLRMCLSRDARRHQAVAQRRGRDGLLHTPTDQPLIAQEQAQAIAITSEQRSDCCPRCRP